MVYSDDQLLGLEAAKAVYDMSMKVSILIRQSYPLNRQLDASAGELVLKKIEGMGVEVKTRYSPDGIVTEKDADGVETFKGFRKGDEVVDSDMVVFAIGIKPRDDLAVTSGIKTAEGGGIEVGDDLQSSADGVFAIGECASWRGNVSDFLK
jgi:nitrite reductase (NAD(P)H)